MICHIITFQQKTTKLNKKLTIFQSMKTTKSTYDGDSHASMSKS